MFKIIKSFIKSFREPRPEWIVECRLHADVPPRSVPTVEDYMNDFFLGDIKIDHRIEDQSFESIKFKIRFNTEEYAPHEVITTFYIIQDDLEALCPDGLFAIEQISQRKPSFLDALDVKWKAFISRTRKRRYQINKKWAERLKYKV